VTEDDEQMKFSRYLEEVAQMFDDAPPLIKYKVLSDYIKNTVSQCMEQNLGDDLWAGEECKLCNEPWTLGPGIITTKCRHSFHPTCLIRSLRSCHSSRSCPVCGCSVQNFMPLGFGGSILQFHAMVQININAVEAYHVFLLDGLQRRFGLVKDVIRKSAFDVRIAGPSSYDAVFAEDLKATILMLLRKIQFAEFYGRICYQAVHKILKKFDKHTTLETMPALLLGVHSMRFFLDCCCPGEGDLVAMRRDLLELLPSLESAEIMASSSPNTPLYRLPTPAELPTRTTIEPSAPPAAA
jgi:hypothetical protein